MSAGESGGRNQVSPLSPASPLLQEPQLRWTPCPCGTGAGLLQRGISVPEMQSQPCLVHCVGELESETMSSAQANKGGNRRGARRYKLGWESGRGGRAPGRGCTPVISRLLRTRRHLLPAPARQALVKAVGSVPTPSRAPGRLPVRLAPSVTVHLSVHQPPARCGAGHLPYEKRSNGITSPSLGRVFNHEFPGISAVS